jgi:hypothetical protein
MLYLPWPLGQWNNFEKTRLIPFVSAYSEDPRALVILLLFLALLSMTIPHIMQIQSRHFWHLWFIASYLILHLPWLLGQSNKYAAWSKRPGDNNAFSTFPGTFANVNTINYAAVNIAELTFLSESLFYDFIKWLGFLGSFPQPSPLSLLEILMEFPTMEGFQVDQLENIWACTIKHFTGVIYPVMNEINYRYLLSQHILYLNQIKSTST